MKKIELKIPPVVALLITLLGLWLSSLLLGNSHWPSALRWTGLFVFATTGIGVAALGVRQFRQAQTSFSPTQPSTASTLVDTGIFAYTRNPMYLGMALVIIGLVSYAGHSLLAVWPVVFVAYLTQFQIKPEERRLSEKFGEAFSRYTRRVRRWI
ncbi:MAG: protein-S-isoprenylcysteine methyltransferase [Gammaproteobacteria bacterium]|nr:MAG: protein-S-isoprenylcysteine methyltransferase [Gammaproteobacteria bacterium]